MPSNKFSVGVGNMDYLPFDSRNKLYKDPFGATPSGSEITFRVVLHKDAKADSVFMIVAQDGSGTNYIEMPFAFMVDENFCAFECKKNFSEGLYFYSFYFESDYGRKNIKRVPESKGIICEDGGLWQQTVYEKDFNTPKNFEGGIIYQIFPDRFYNSKTPKNDVPSDRFFRDDWGGEPYYVQNGGKKVLGNDYFGGDLKGIEEKLSYLSELGVSCIYLNPIFEAHSNHRYNTADYEQIDPLLGSEEDLISLCSSAKQYGISVILDGVFSHTGDDSKYFNKQGRYNSQGAYNDKLSRYFNWYKFYNWPAGYQSWWGVPSMPELIEENEDFSDYINGKEGIIRKYLRDGVAGWRLDVADELPDEFLDKLRESAKEENPNAFILGEVWEDATNKISYGFRRRFLRGKQLDSVMNYPFKEAIFNFLKGGNANDLMQCVLYITENYPPMCVNLLMNHIGTHDTARALTTLAGEEQADHDRNWQSNRNLSDSRRSMALTLIRLAAVLQYTLPGIPSIYYGDEAGMEGYGDPFCRGCYPWGNEDESLIEFYKKLGDCRRSINAFKNGEFNPIDSDCGHIVYERRGNSDRVIIGVNRDSKDHSIFVGEYWNTAQPIFGIAAQNGYLNIPSMGYSILKSNNNDSDYRLRGLSLDYIN